MPGAAPAACGGMSATCARPQEHPTSCRSIRHGLRPDLLRQVTDLMGEHHTQVSGILQVCAARAVPFREQVLDPVRVIVPGQVRARRAGLLAGLPLPAPRPGFCFGGVFPG